MKDKNLLVIQKIIVIIAIVAVFFVLNLLMNKSREKMIVLENENEDIAYQIENVVVNGDDLVFSGWVFRLEKVKNEIIEHNEGTIQEMILVELNSQTGEVLYENAVYSSSHMAKGINLDFEKVIRDDVNEYFSCEYDYADSGFIAKVDLSDVDIEDGLYRVAFKGEKGNNRGILTSTYLYKGELYYSNPVTRQILDVNGTDLEKIVNEGICLYSVPENHCNIYQYGWKLYWIVDDEFDFKDDGVTSLVYMLDTTQFTHLPSYRTDNGWYWGNIGSSFETYEVTDTMDCGRYRVSVRDIPNGYSITSITLGSYDNGEWIWNALIRPNYDFTAIPDPKVYGYLGDDVADWMKENN